MFEDFFNRYLNFKNITFIIVLALFLFFIFNFKDISMMFFACFVIACSLNPIVDKLSEKLPRTLAANIVTIGFVFLILAIIIPILMLTFKEIAMFVNKLPNYIDNFDEFLFKLPILKQFHFLAISADHIMEQLSMSYSDIFSHAVDFGKYISKAFVYTLISVIIIFNFISDKITINNYILRAFPSNMRKRAKEVGSIITEKMGGYLVSLLATSASVIIVMLIGLLILKVPYALLLAVITGVLDIIPVIGPALAFVICLVAVYESGFAVLASVVVVFALAQLIENNFVRPYVFGKVMRVHPIVIFLFLFIAAEYIGIVGVIFAPALAALVAVIFEELYLKKLD